MKICYQLFSVHDLMSKKENITSIFSKLSDIGYDGIEMYHFDDDVILDNVVSIAKEYNLEIVSSHLNFELIRDNKTKFIEIMEKANIKNAVLPIIMDIAQSQEQMELRLNEIKEIKKNFPNDFNLYYHNHNMECKKINDKLVLENINYELPLELDIFWIMSSGLSPISCLKNFNSSPLIHFKDIEVVEDGNGWYKVVDCPIGRGNMELQAMVDACIEHNIECIIVEQETNSPDINKRFEDMQFSYTNIKEAINESINNK